MKTLIKYISGLLILGIIGSGCYKEEKLTPSGDEPVMSEKDLPQGNQPYDERIMQYWNDYAVLVFYRFPEKEFWWTPTVDIRPKPARGEEGGTSSGYEGKQADEQYVGKLIELLDNEFFSWYSQEFLNHRMPKKLLLMSELNKVSSSMLEPDMAPRQRMYAYSVFDHLAINMANAGILLMNQDSINDFRGELNSVFLNWQVDVGFTENSPEFMTVSDYGTSYDGSTATMIKNMYKAGLINVRAGQPNSDWKEFIKAIVTHSYDELAGEIDPVVFKPGTTTITKEGYSKADPHLGILNADKKKGWDSSGKIKQKYDIITDWFKQKYKIDLQAIGNGVKTNTEK